MIESIAFAVVINVAWIYLFHKQCKLIDKLATELAACNDKIIEQTKQIERLRNNENQNN